MPKLLDLKDLANRMPDVTAFDADAVTVAIEALTDEDLTSLTKNHLPSCKKVLDRVRKLLPVLSKEFVERDDAINMALACCIARVNMLLVGPPGTAKSLLIRRLSYHLRLQSPVIETTMSQRERMEESRKSTPASPAEADKRADGQSSRRRYYELLMTRYTTAEEVLGPADLDLMITKRIYFRLTRGLLPEAEIAFLDEIWRANAAILNALLTITQERIFHNAGVAVRVPLYMAYTASNDLPTDKELFAIFDRFPVRVHCPPVQDTKKLVLCQHPTDVKWAATVNDFRFLHRVLLWRLTDDVVLSSYGPEHFNTFDRLKGPYRISDRTGKDFCRLAGAVAMLNGDGTFERDANLNVTRESLKVFKYAYMSLDQEPDLASVVEERINRG